MDSDSISFLCCIKGKDANNSAVAALFVENLVTPDLSVMPVTRIFDWLHNI